MKKTLIALAVVASAAISGSAMAWTPGSTGGSVELSGTLTPVVKTVPWSVKVGNTSGLDANIYEGGSVVNVPVNHSVLFLGITTAAGDAGFPGQDGINPQIDYKGAVDVDKFVEGVTKVTLPVKDKDQNYIGFMEAKFAAGAMQQWKEKDKVIRRSMEGSEPGDGFYGGVGINDDAVMAGGKIKDRLDNLDPEIASSAWQHDVVAAANHSTFSNDWTYQGFYGGGIEKGQKIKITLYKPAKGGEEIKWYASLPVVISYQ